MDERPWVICDSDVLIDYWDRSSKRHAHARSIIDGRIGRDRSAMSVVTWMELTKGATDRRSQQRVRKELASFRVVMLNANVCQCAMQTLERYHLSHGLQIPDCLIAASCLLSGWPLFTYNVRDFKFIEGISLLDG